jgi:uncharacterized protein YheU (UPF0270 family)
MKSTRCDAVTIQLIVTDYDEHGRPLREHITQPVKVFRAAATEFWSEVDKAVDAMVKEAAATPPAQPTPTP